jgi:radical SAM protein with 4Fe4S-binding SPASM domain
MKDKMANLQEFPDILNIELTNLCNLQCRMCPTGRGLLMRKQGFMSNDTFEKILTEAAAHDTAIRFVRWGEPTLHPNLMKFVRMVESYGLLCHINTNGFFMDDKIISDMIQIPLDSIKFSMQGVTKDEYEKWRQGGNFLLLLGWIKELYLRRNRRKLPFITIGTTVSKRDEENIKEFKCSMRSISDSVLVGTIRNIIARTERGNNPNCPEVFNKLSINYNGDVTACCADYDDYMKIGNIHKNTLKELWTSNRINYYREMLCEGRHAELEICKSCIIGN